MSDATPAQTTLEAKSEFELRVDMGKSISEADVKAAQISGDLGFSALVHDRLGC